MRPGRLRKIHCSPAIRSQRLTRLSLDQEAWRRGIRSTPLAPNLHREIEIELRARLTALFCSGVDVVLDFSFWSRREREEYRTLLRPLGVEPETIYLATPRDVVLERVRSSHRPWIWVCARSRSRGRLLRSLRTAEQRRRPADRHLVTRNQHFFPCSLLQPDVTSQAGGNTGGQLWRDTATRELGCTRQSFATSSSGLTEFAGIRERLVGRRIAVRVSICADGTESTYLSGGTRRARAERARALAQVVEGADSRMPGVDRRQPAAQTVFPSRP